MPVNNPKELFLLMLSGLYLFVLPYATRWRDKERPQT